LVNRSATWADFDEQLVALEMAELKAADFDLSLTGFDAPEIDAFLFSGDLEQRADEVPEPQTTVVSATGDVWGCGDHRVGCGDSTDSAMVERLLAGRTPHLMVTDPSYGVGYDPLWREQLGLGAQRQTGPSLNDDRADWTAAY